MSRIDRFFCNEAWDIAFDDHTLHAFSSNHSDHCPLLLARSSGPRRPRPFKFENFWLKLPRFHETVQQAWNQPSHHTEPFHRLGHKLHVTAKALRSWSASLISDAKLKFFMAQTVIHLFEVMQETRPLSDAKFNIRSKLKQRLLGWAVIERARKRQCSRVRNLREEDANTRFFHLKANGQRRKNFIQRLRTHEGWAVTHQDKSSVVQSHFTAFMAAPSQRTCVINWPALNLPRVDLSHLDKPFDENEIKFAISQLPSDSAPGPDGFTGACFKKCWNI
jgi:hypothetical protein